MPASPQSTVELVGDFDNWVSAPVASCRRTRSDGWRVTQVQAAAGEREHLPDLRGRGRGHRFARSPTTAFRPDGTEVTWVERRRLQQAGSRRSARSTVDQGRAKRASVTRAHPGHLRRGVRCGQLQRHRVHDGAAIHSDRARSSTPQAGTATIALHQLPKGKNTVTLEAKDVNGTLADTAVATLCGSRTSRLRPPRHDHLPDHDRPLRQRAGPGRRRPRRLRPAAPERRPRRREGRASTPACSARSG